MKRTGIGLGEPEEEPPSPDINIRITLPEEFAGWIMGEVVDRKGSITGMDGGMEGQDRIVVVAASLPASQWDALQEFVIQATQGRGKVKRVD